MAAWCTVCLILVCVLGKSLSQTAPKCKMFGIFEIIPKDDCTGWYSCVWGEPVEMPNCQQGSVFSRSAHVCVPINSIDDDCSLHQRVITTRQSPVTIEEQCSQDRTAIIPHPTECQLYYNCSVSYTFIPRHFEQHLVECRYPNLFSTDTLKCEDFDTVKCGNRRETKSGCGYRSLQCPGAHCIPCSIRVPSCELMPDGINPHPVKKWSPYYIVCKKERFISEEICPADEEGRTQLFSPETNMCTRLDFISQEHGGLMNNCTGKADGANADDFNRCDRYAECRNGKFVNIVKCPSGLVFDTAERKCVLGKDACAPCGGKQGCTISMCEPAFYISGVVQRRFRRKGNDNEVECFQGWCFFCLMQQRGRRSVKCKHRNVGSSSSEIQRRKDVFEVHRTEKGSDPVIIYGI